MILEKDEICTCTMENALHKLMGEDYSECSGTTKKDGYMAFYHERGLYSVEHEDSGIVSLVYAGNPYEAIKLVDEFRRIRADLRKTEAVEMCPHCMEENVFTNYDVRKEGYKVRCRHCGNEIMLCDECRHNADYHQCDWHETYEGGACYRGETKLEGK